MSKETDFLAGVDRAALVLAAVAGSVTFTMTPGPWTGFTSFVGCLLLFMVVGFHRPVSGGTRLRRVLGRLAFGFTSVLTLAIIVAMPVQTLSRKTDVLSSWLILIWFPAGVAVAWFEPQVTKMLDGGGASGETLRPGNVNLADHTHRVGAMSASSIVEKHIAAFNAKNDSDEPWSDDAELVGPGGSASGRDNVLAFLRVFHTAFPDGCLSVTTQIEDGSRVALEGVFDGTHNGPLASPAGEVPPTRRAISFRWAALYEVDGSSLRSEHVYYDQADFLAQLGLQ